MFMKDFDESDSQILTQLRELVLKYLDKGEVSKRVIDYLFKVYGSPDRVVANDISLNGGPQGDANVASHMARFRQQLANLFDYEAEGRSSKFRVLLTDNDKGNYALVLQKNSPPSEVLSSFWHHHFTPARTHIVYPELSCSCRRNHSESSRHANEESIAIDPESGGIGGLNQTALKHGLVSSSSVRSMLRLMTFFQTWQVPLTAVAVPPTTSMVEGNLIVLGTPRSMPLMLPMLEATVPMKTSEKGVTINWGRDSRAPSCLEDTSENAETPEGTELEKRVVLTRHHYPFQRTWTILGAKDELAGEAIVQVLTNETAMLMLARELKCRDTFPDHFQALFTVHMAKGHPYARKITVDHAMDLSKAA